MTREEAIKGFEDMKKGLYPFYPDEYFDMAIKALKFAESYETRLKADMVAMLTDMLIDVEEIASREQWCDYANDNCISRYDVEDLFQQKINALKAESEDQDGQTND